MTRWRVRETAWKGSTSVIESACPESRFPVADRHADASEAPVSRALKRLRRTRRTVVPSYRGENEFSVDASEILRSQAGGGIEEEDKYLVSFSH